MKRNLAVYLLLIAGFGLGIYFALHAGKRLELVRQSLPAALGGQVLASTTTNAPAGDVLSSTWQGIRDHLREPVSLLLVQLLLIVILARLFGSLFVRLGQPSVIGEMVAGIVLGPSVVGTFAPGAFAFIFPTESLGALRMLSQVGVILFMFVVGMEVELEHLRKKAHTAIVVSQAGIVFPFFLGVLLSLYLYGEYAPVKIDFLAFALFMGTAMSMTAFPVLARIIAECGMAKSYLGVTAITCAAMSDVSAWSILAVVVAIAKAGSPAAFLVNLGLALAFCLVLVGLVKPLLHRWFTPPTATPRTPGPGIVVTVLVLVFAAALFTEVIGLHALFGAFLVGIIMPLDPQFRTQLRDRLENFSTSFLLPLFFAFIGLRTQIGLLNDWHGWSVCGFIILVATTGKLGGSMIAARWTGMNWPDAFSLGALMNTRGLVELIVLNIGYELGILSAQVFAMMVIMALVTTFMTGPLLGVGNAMRRRSAVAPAKISAV